MTKLDGTDKTEVSVESVSPKNDAQETVHDGATLIASQTKVRRIFSHLQIFLFALTYMSSWEAVAENLAPAFNNGGPRALSWGFLIVYAGALAQSASLAEMSAIQPIAGAQYHWTAALAPKRYARVITWFQGWMTWLGWISVLAGVANITAYIIQVIAINNYPSYVPQPWHLTMIILAILFIQSLMMTYTFRMLPWIELCAGFLHVSLFVIFLAVLLGTTEDKHTAEFVFFQKSNASGWTNDYLSWNIGLLTPAWGFVGFDAAVHMSEEVRKSRHAIPRAMFWSIAINGAMAYVMALTVLFCVGDFEDTLTTYFPLLTIIMNATGSLKVATLMCCGLLLVSLAVSLATIASVSRLTWAWARDGGLPKYFSYISETYRVPVRALWLPVFITGILALVNVGSTAAFGAFVALSAMGLYVSYIIAISCMLHARLSRNGVQLAEWNLGRLGVPVNIFALLYSVYMFIWLPFPSSLPVTGANMNYAAPIFAFALLFSLVSWWAWARKNWLGLNKHVLEAVLADSDRTTID